MGDKNNQPAFIYVGLKVYLTQCCHLDPQDPNVHPTLSFGLIFFFYFEKVGIPLQVETLHFIQ